MGLHNDPTQKVRNNVFDHLVIEISGRCNAHCKWCTTGRANVAGKRKGEFMKPSALAEILDYMRTEKIISPEAVIFLYNWGEPFLHPKFEAIAQVIAERGYQFVVSTNLSVWPKISDKTILSHLKAIVVSMPGFSQASYDRQHGFSFEKIKQNITEMVSSYRAKGFKGKVQVKYHVYQFNLNETPAVLDFVKSQNIGLHPTYASFADLDLYMDYLEGSLTRQEERTASRELLLSKIAEEEIDLPEDYECPYYAALILNEKAEIVTCCMVTPQMDDFVIGGLFDIHPDEVDIRKRKQKICKRCIRLAIPERIAQRSYPSFLDEIDIPLQYVPTDKEVLIWGAGVMAERMAQRLNSAGITNVRFINDDFTEIVANLPESKLVAPDVLSRNKGNSFVIVANEYISPCVEQLLKCGFVSGKDFMVNSIVARG